MGWGRRRRKTNFTLMTRDVVFLLLFPSPLHPLLSTNKIHFFRHSHDNVRGRDRWFRGLGFGDGEHTGEDEIDAVELDDLENDDITEEETKRAEVDAASSNPKLPKAHGHMGSPNRAAWTAPKILFGSRALQPNVLMDFPQNAPFCFAPLTWPRPVSVEVSEFRFAKRPH